MYFALYTSEIRSVKIEINKQMNNYLDLLRLLYPTLLVYA